AESGGTLFRVDAGRVVLSAGAIRSPWLLMLSGIGPEEQLAAFGIPVVRHLPGVGENLMNHCSAQTTFKVKDGVSLEAHRHASPDPAVQPEFNYRYLHHPSDARRVREGLRLAARLLESEVYGDVLDYRIHPAGDILANDDALDLWMRQTVGTARHVSGTCKMGPDADPMAVVDQYCRVKGIQGLWVADASVMPRIRRSGGAHATLMIIGERVADVVGGDAARH